MYKYISIRLIGVILPMPHCVGRLEHSKVTLWFVLILTDGYNFESVIDTLPSYIYG